jgi:hypothetical protein
MPTPRLNRGLRKRKVKTGHRANKKLRPDWEHAFGVPVDDIADVLHELDKKGLDPAQIARALCWGTFLQYNEPGMRGTQGMLEIAREYGWLVTRVLRELKPLEQCSMTFLRPEERKALADLTAALHKRERAFGRVQETYRDLGKRRAPRDAFARGGPVDRVLAKLGVKQYRTEIEDDGGPQLRSRLLKWARKAQPNSWLTSKAGSEAEIFPREWWSLLEKPPRRRT